MLGFLLVNSVDNQKTSTFPQKNAFFRFRPLMAAVTTLSNGLHHYTLSKGEFSLPC